MLAGCHDRDLDGYRAEEHGGEDCDDDNAAVHPGADEVCGDGVDNDCVPGVTSCGPWGDLTADQAAAEVGFEGSMYRPGMAALADWDGDGLGDLAVGNLFAGTGPLGFGSGTVWIHRGPLKGTVWPDQALATFEANDGEEAGSALVFLEIAGEPVLAIGMEFFHVDGVGAAGAVAFLHPADPPGTTLASLPKVVGSEDLDVLGRFMEPCTECQDGTTLLLLVPGGHEDVEGELIRVDSVPDGEVSRDQLPLLFNNDVTGLNGFASTAVIPGASGHPDWIFVGLPRLQPIVSTTGTVVGFPASDQVATTTSAPLRLEGSQDGDYFGWRLVAADFDGDGTGDLAVLAPRRERGGDRGAVHFLFGRWDTDGWTVDEETVLMLGGPHWSGTGDDPDMDLVGDLNGDGYPELAIGANWTTREGGGLGWYGCTYLLYGPVERGVQFEDVDASICGSWEDEQVGVEVEAGGDLDGDGYGDLLVGSYRSVYVFPGGPGL